MKSILVIDDNPDIRDNTAEILSLAGYKTFTAENGKEGVELALQESPDLIVCDIMMPELDGFGVLHLLRKKEATENIPFVFLTAKTERSDFRKGMEMGADDYITKPFDDIELLNAIEVRLKKAAVLNNQYTASHEGINAFIKDVKSVGLIKQLADQYDIENFAKKQTLYQESKRPRYLYYLVKGKVKAFKTHEDGKDYITDLFTSGDFIGYPALIEDKNYDDSAIVMEDAEIMQIPKDDFLQMMYGNMDVATKFIKIITQNVKEKEDRLLNLAYSSLRKRVAKALVAIQAKFNSEQPDKPLVISREDFAHYVGTATESLIRTLSDFKSEKLIAIKEGKISIIDAEKLKNLLY
ncbi:MAG: response regulator [Chitinophagaceae bacterium]|nr:response regulator [Chitinophagaceae bacterium]MCB0740870.1 response regulator [Chitinophagaceae bacterium]HQV05749.1 response regulator [Chitinophagaceae bacterium]